MTRLIPGALRHLSGAPHLSVTAGTLLGASALGAAVWHERGHRRLAAAQVVVESVLVEPLTEYVARRQDFEQVEAGLRDEWGEYALLGLDDFDDYLRLAGRTTYIASRNVGGAFAPIGVLQSTIKHIGGDPDQLLSRFPTFDALVAQESWSESTGDTAVLLQLTVLDGQARGGGVGTLLRNVGLYLLPDSVKYALTTTPIDGKDVRDVVLEAPDTFTASMRFHVRGGATPAKIVPRYKRQRDSGLTRHGDGIAVMRYQATAAKRWMFDEPVMNVSFRSPMASSLRSARRILAPAVKRSALRFRRGRMPRGDKFAR